MSVTWVDAFSERPFGGNPAAVCVLEGPAEEDWMQALANEFGISETAFLWPLPDGSHSLRWFTPSSEVDLCGHATLAAAHVLGEPPGGVLRFSTKSGVLSARFDGEVIELDFPAAPPSDAGPPPLLGSLPAFASARNSFFLVAELESPEAVAAFAPDLSAIAALPDRAVIVTSKGGPGAADYVLRVFAPNVGIDEDPVTGAAQCALGPYWAPRLGKATFEARQLSARTGQLRVRLDDERVLIAGPCATVMSGSL